MDKQIFDKLNNLEQKMISIQSSIDELSTKLDNINNSCNNMDSHISFVEHIINKLNIKGILNSFNPFYSLTY